MARNTGFVSGSLMIRRATLDSKLHFVSKVLCSAAKDTGTCEGYTSRKNKVVLYLAAKHVRRGEACVSENKSRNRSNLKLDGKLESFDVGASFKNR